MVGAAPDRTGSQAPVLPRRAEMVLAGVVFALHAAISIQGIGELFLEGHRGYNGAMRSGIARHYVEHGLCETGGKPIKNTFSIEDPRNGIVHWHHPPLSNMLVAGSFAVFGESEASARAVPIAACLASFWLIYFLVRRRYGQLPALASTLVFALLPMQIEYGKMVNYESLVTCFALLALFGLDLARHGRRPWLGYVCAVAGICLGCACDWPAYLFAGAICIEALARKPRKPIVFLAGGAAAAGLLVLIWLWLNPADTGRDLGWLAEFRVGANTRQGTFEALFDKTYGRGKLFFGWTALFTGGAWILYEAVRHRRVDAVVAVFLPATAVFLGVFRHGAVYHLFFYQYFVPTVAVASGVGAVALTGLAAKAVARLGRRVPPLAVRAVVAVVWFALFGVFQVRSVMRLRLESYRFYGEVVDGVPKGLPHALQLDSALLGLVLNEMSEPDDVVLLYRGSHARSLTFKHYLWRRVRHVGSAGSLGRGDLAALPERRVSEQDQARLARRYPLVRTMRHLIYDLRRDGEGPQARQLDFVTEPADFWWTWLHSAVYPPHRLVENPKAAEAYLDKLGL